MILSCGRLDSVWEQSRYQPCHTGWDTRSAKENFSSSSNIMRDLKGKTWMLRLDLQNPAENLQPSSALVWKWCYCCRILIWGSRHWAFRYYVLLWYYVLLSILIKCIINNNTLQFKQTWLVMGPQHQLRNWEALLECEYLKCESKFCPSLWLQGKELPTQQKNKQAEYYTKQSPLNASANRQQRQFLTPLPMNK